MGNVADLAARSVRDGDCLRWTRAHTPKGYGQIKIDGMAIAVHRLAYETAIGPIPDGYEIDHVRDRGCRLKTVTDDVTGCWNWISTRDPQGTPRMHVHGRNVRAARWFYMLGRDPLPAQSELVRTCDNGDCVNVRIKHTLRQIINVKGD